MPNKIPPRPVCCKFYISGEVPSHRGFHEGDSREEITVPDDQPEDTSKRHLTPEPSNSTHEQSKSIKMEPEDASPESSTSPYDPYKIIKTEPKDE